MKKLLFGAILSISFALGANAQLPYLQNFEVTQKVLPAGWSAGVASYHPGNAGWQFNNTWPAGGRWLTYVATHTYCAFVDDIDANTKPSVDYDTLSSSAFSCAGSAHVFMTFDLNFNNYTGVEVGTIAVSTDGGKTWKTAATLPSASPDVTWHNGLVADLSSLIGNQTNVKIAFTWNNVAAVQQGYPGWGMAVDNINIHTPPNYSVAAVSQNLMPMMQVNKSYVFSGIAADSGGNAITSMTMNYSVNGGPVKSQNMSGIGGFTSLTDTTWTLASIPFKPLAAGNYTVKYWATNLNGGNPNANTDTLVAHFYAIDTIQVREALYEEFTGQSCVYCLLAAPNMDTVADNNAYNSTIIRYHVPIPERDFMYDATTPFVNPREAYYGVNAAPDGYLDAYYLYPGGLQPNAALRYSSTSVQAEDEIGSPFKITITKAKYVASKDSFEVSANIKSYGNFPAGLTAQIVLTIDSLTYKYDLSMEDPRPSFQPPIGSSSGGSIQGGAPDFLYPYTLKYTHVAEEMLPSASGTALAAFTAGQSQTISLQWKRNHPWGSYDKPVLQRDSDFYDSSATGQFVVFVQSDNGISTMGIPAGSILQSNKAGFSGMKKAAGVEEISNGVPFKMYPNPTNNNTNLAFNLDQDQNVTVQVYNMLGEVVYTANEGMLSSGQHTIMINGSTLNNGVYLVRLATDNGLTVQRLLIQR